MLIIYEGHAGRRRLIDIGCISNLTFSPKVDRYMSLINVRYAKILFIVCVFGALGHLFARETFNIVVCFHFLLIKFTDVLFE